MRGEDGDNNYRTRGEVINGWVELLNRYPWNWFLTLTFRSPVHPERAVKLFKFFVTDINQTLYGKSFARKGLGVYWALATEYQQRGVLHFHALMGGAGLSDLRRLSFMDRWNELAGFARIMPPDNTAAVNHYVSKYVIKGGEIELGGRLPIEQEEQGEGILPLF